MDKEHVTPLDDERTELAPSQPRQIGAYVLEDLLGRGGMGEVWRARDTRLNRPVALKLLRYDDPDDLKRFLREARTAAQLAHPNIAPVFEATERYIAMQLVDGTTLHRYPRRDPRELARIIRDAARALDYAHRHGVVHRDLKPENIMIDREGRVFIMDFGLAKPLHVESSVSGTGVMIGTPAFMPPEQATGRSDETDGRSDIYSLGASLYAVLAGRPPFDDPDVITLLTRVVHDEPEPLSRLRPGLDHDLSTIVMKCLEKQRARRYDTAEALAQEIDRWLAGEPILARPPSLARRLRRGFTRWRTAIVAAAAVLVAVAGVAAFVVPRWRKADRELATETGRQRQRVAAETRARLHLENGRRLLDQMRLLKQDPAYTDDGLRALAQRTDAAYRLAFTDVPDHAEAHLGIARAWIEAFEYDRGRAALDRAIAAAPDFATPYIERLRLNAQLYEELGHDKNERGADVPELPQIEKALNADLEHVHRSSKDAVELDFARALMAFARSDYAASEKMLASYLAASPQDLGALRCRGHAVYHLKRWDEAIDLFTRSLRLDAREASVLLMRAYCHERRGRDDLALQDIDRSLEIRNSLNAVGIRARLRGNLGDPAGALADLDRVIPAHPTNWSMRLDRAELRRRRGDYDGAIADVEAAAKLQPDEPLVAIHRARTLRDRGDLDGALAALARATTAEGLSDRAAIHRRRRDFDAAQRDIDRAIEMDAGDSNHLVERGLLSTVRNDLDAALRDFDRAIEMDKMSYSAFCNRGIVRYRRQDFKGAADDYGRAIAIHPACWEALYNRGVTREILGDVAGAIDDLARAIAIRPRMVGQYYMRAVLLHRKGDRAGAAADAKKAIELGLPDEKRAEMEAIVREADK